MVWSHTIQMRRSSSSNAVNIPGAVPQHYREYITQHNEDAITSASQPSHRLRDSNPYSSTSGNLIFPTSQSFMDTSYVFFNAPHSHLSHRGPHSGHIPQSYHNHHTTTHYVTSPAYVRCTYCQHTVNSTDLERHLRHCPRLNSKQQTSSRHIATSPQSPYQHHSSPSRSGPAPSTGGWQPIPARTTSATSPSHFLHPLPDVPEAYAPVQRPRQATTYHSDYGPRGIGAVSAVSGAYPVSMAPNDNSSLQPAPYPSGSSDAYINRGRPRHRTYSDLHYSRR